MRRAGVLAIGLCPRAPEGDLLERQPVEDRRRVAVEAPRRLRALAGKALGIGGQPVRARRACQGVAQGHKKAPVAVATATPS